MENAITTRLPLTYIPEDFLSHPKAKGFVVMLLNEHIYYGGMLSHINNRKDLYKCFGEPEQIQKIEAVLSGEIQPPKLNSLNDEQINHVQRMLCDYWCKQANNDLKLHKHIRT